MGLITTQSIGFGEPKPKAEQKADPKPVRGFNYAGEPMKEGEYYNGRPEHMDPERKRGVGRPTLEEAALPFHRPARKYNVGAGKGHFKRSEESRMKSRAKALALWAARRAAGQNSKETVIKKANPETESG